MFSSSTPVQELKNILKGPPVHNLPNDWGGWPNVQKAHIELMEDLIKTLPEYPEGRYKGRGVVISTNAKPGYSSGKHLAQGYFPGSWVVYKELRRLGCTLPVTFAYMGDLEMDPYLLRLCEKEGIKCINLYDYLDRYPMRILAGWESKVYSVLVSEYEEVLYLDADSIPVKDPTYLFQSPQMKHHGGIFFPDLPPYDRSEWLRAVCWENVGLHPRTDYVAYESGQFFLNKKIAWEELLVSKWVNEHSDWFYQFIFGDKDTFLLASCKVQNMLGKNGFAITRHPAQATGRGINQRDFDGEVVFQHQTQNKPDINDFPNPNRDYVKNIDYCREHLAELRSKWDGVLWDNPNPTEEEKKEALEIMSCIWEYEREGLGKRDMRFLEDKRIGRGLATREVSWDVFCTDREKKLIIKGLDGKLTLTAVKRKDNSWAGKWCEYERCNVYFKKKKI